MQNTADARRKLWIVTLIILVFSAIGLVTMEMYITESEKAFTEDHKNRFEIKISRARGATANPCATVFYDLVIPHPTLKQKPRYILMGKDSLELPTYPELIKLIAAGDKVELWIFSESDGKWHKVGQKYNPDSEYCKNYGK